MHWYYFVLFSSIGATLFASFIKLSNQKINPMLGTVILQMAALAISLIAFIFLKDKTENANEVFITTEGIIYSALAGVIIVFVNISIFMMYHAGAPLSIASPAMRILSTIMTFIVGLIFFKENINFVKFIGLAMAVSGVYLLMKK